MALETEKVNGVFRGFMKLIESIGNFGESVRSEGVVAIEENEIFTGRLFDTGITSFRKAGIGLNNEMDAGVFLSILTTNRGGRIGGTVIDEDNLVIGKILA